MFSDDMDDMRDRMMGNDDDSSEGDDEDNEGSMETEEELTKMLLKLPRDPSVGTGAINYLNG